MKKSFLYSLIGVVSLILVVALFIGVSSGLSEVLDSLGDAISDVSKETSDNGDVHVPGGSSSNTPTEAQAFKLGDPELKVSAINNLSGTVAKLGVSTTALKANTKYRITWVIDYVSLEEYTDCCISSDGGYYLLEFSLDHSTVNDKGLEKMRFGDKEFACNNPGGIIFTTSSTEGAEFSFYFFEMPFVDVATTVAAKSYVTTYVTNFTITEVFE